MIDEIPSELDKQVKKDMKEVVETCTEEIFNSWVNGSTMNENYDIRKSILKLTEKEDIIKYKNYIYDKTVFENHGKLILLMKDKEFIQEHSQDMMKNSFKEFGIHNVFSKIELLAQYEKETKIERFKYNEASPNVKDTTWNMIKKLYRKTTKKPETQTDVVKEYVSMVNNISKIYDSKQKMENNERSRIYELNTDTLKASYKLDKINDKSRSNYCAETLKILEFKKTKESDKVESVDIIKTDLDYGL